MTFKKAVLLGVLLAYWGDSMEKIMTKCEMLFLFKRASRVLVMKGIK